MMLIGIFVLGALAAGPFLLGALWLAARLGDRLPADPAELVLAYAAGPVERRHGERAAMKAASPPPQSARAPSSMRDVAATQMVPSPPKRIVPAE